MPDEAEITQNEQQADATELTGEELLTEAVKQFSGASDGSLTKDDEREEVEKKSIEVSGDDKPNGELKDVDINQRLLKADQEVSKLRREIAEIKKRPSLDELKDQAKKDPDALAKELGWDPYEAILRSTAAEVTEAAKNKDPGQTELPEELRVKLKELEELKEWRNKQEAITQKQQVEAFKSEGIKKASSWLEENKEKAPIISSHSEGANTVFMAVIDHYNANKDYYDAQGKMPSHEDVIDALEKKAEESTKKHLDWVVSVPPLRSYIEEKMGVRVPTKLEDPAAPPSLSTLTNNMQSERAEEEEPTSEADRIQLAIRQIQANPSG